MRIKGNKFVKYVVQHKTSLYYAKVSGDSVAWVTMQHVLDQQDYPTTWFSRSQAMKQVEFMIRSMGYGPMKDRLQVVEWLEPIYTEHPNSPLIGKEFPK